MRQITLLILSVALTVACTDSNQGELVDQPVSAPESAQSAQDQQVAQGELPPGHPPLQNPPMMQQNMGMGMQPQEQHSVSIEGTQVTIGPIAFEIGENWKSAPPSSSMRAAQFVIPPAEGQIEPAELAIFQGITGTNQQNIDRWIGQFQIPEGTAPEDVTIVEKRQVGEFNVQTLDIQGVYIASMGPMMSGGQAMENYRMLGAAVEGPGGPWHFKLVGPVDAVEASKEAFEKMVSSLRTVE
ncbi:MAG: hypothetical protein ACOX5R_07830 [bacterium]|jgi:hypothetical protein